VDYSISLHQQIHKTEAVPDGIFFFFFFFFSLFSSFPFFFF